MLGCGPLRRPRNPNASCGSGAERGDDGPVWGGDAYLARGGAGGALYGVAGGEEGVEAVDELWVAAGDEELAHASHDGAGIDAGRGV